MLSALGRLAKIKAGDGPDSQAIEHLEKALEAGSQTSSTFEDLAEMYSRSNRDFEALETLSGGVEALPYNPGLHKLLILKYINLRLYDEALKAARAYTALFPEDTAAKDLLVQVQNARGRP